MERRLNQPLRSKRKIHDSADEDEPLIFKRSRFASTINSTSIGETEHQEQLQEPEDGEHRQSDKQEEEGEEDPESEELEEDQQNEEQEEDGEEDQESEELEEDQKNEEQEEDGEEDQESEEQEEDQQNEEQEEDGAENQESDEELDEPENEGEDGYEGPYNEPTNAADREGHGSNIVVILTEPALLDCPICFEPLTIPVFQCDQNGHISCSTCCTKINNKCPSCSCPIGSNRCRAVEKIVESIATPCQNIKYGCNTRVIYNKKIEHEKTCLYLPCSCPYFGCTFVSSAKELYKHYSNNHVYFATEFVCDDDFRSFSITLTKMDRFIVLREKNDGRLFVLYNDRVVLGNLVTLSCIQPSFMERFNYYLVVKHEETTLKLRSVTKSTQGQKNYSPPNSSSSLLIPHDFFDSWDDQLEMEICIWRKKDSSHDRKL